MHPAIFKILETLAPRYGVTRVRYSREALSLASLANLKVPAGLSNVAKWALLRARSAQVRPKLATTDAFFGIVHSGLSTRRALAAAILAARADRSTEICIHPGFCAPSEQAVYPQPSYNAYISAPARRMEHDALADEDIQELARRRGLALRAFDGRAKL